MKLETNTVRDILKMIELKRIELHHVAANEGFSTSALQLSKELDRLLNLYEEIRNI